MRIDIASMSDMMNTVETLRNEVVTTQLTLFQRLGGDKIIIIFSDNLINELYSNPKTKPFF
jgi:hypothetical protein